MMTTIQLMCASIRAYQNLDLECKVSMSNVLRTFCRQERDKIRRMTTGLTKLEEFVNAVRPDVDVDDFCIR